MSNGSNPGDHRLFDGQYNNLFTCTVVEHLEEPSEFQIFCHVSKILFYFWKHEGNILCKKT